eukprot:Anaeramoba_ignava/a347256_21.p1 GENE.a347256_21~~a347256_21.p1  ORF type:complete len:663 (+),score=144.60 a347256_21:78-2066(+)
MLNIWKQIQKNEINEVEEFLMKQKTNTNRNQIYTRILQHSINNSSSIEMISMIINHGGANAINGQNSKGRSSVHLACKNRTRKDVVSLLLKSGGLSDQKDHEGKTPLHLACSRSGNKEIIKLLLEHGSNPELSDSNGSSPLHYACLHSQDGESVKTLLEHQPKSNLKDKKGRTPLHYACISHHPQATVILSLIRSGIAVNSIDMNQMTAINLVCKNRSLSYQAIETLLRNGADPNIRGKNYLHPLHFICMKGNAEIAKLLLDYKANVNITTNINKTPLHYACMCSHGDQVVDLLLRHGSHVNDVDVLTRTPLHYALYARNTSTRTVQLLIQFGAFVNHKDNENNTPISIALRNKASFEIVKILIQKSVKIKRNSDQLSLIQYACLPNASADFFQFIVDKGVDLNLNDNLKNSALHFACKSKHTGFINFLLNHKCKVNALNHKNKTPLHHASKQQLSVETITKLCLKGANPCEKDFKSRTPLSLAATQKNFEIVKILLSFLSSFDNPSQFDHFIPHFTSFIDHFYSFNNDMDNLLTRSEFSDLEIVFKDGSMKIHKLILLLRLNLTTTKNSSKNLPKNNQLILQKIKDILKLKSQKQGMIFFKFIYSGIIESQEELKPICESLGKDIEWINFKRGKQGILRDWKFLFEDEMGKNFTIFFGKFN